MTAKKGQLSAIKAEKYVYSSLSDFFSQPSIILICDRVLTSKKIPVVILSRASLPKKDSLWKG